MTDIVDLDVLVPDDIVFKYRGEELAVPGDLKVPETLRLYKLLKQIADADAAEENEDAELERTSALVQATLLDVFKIRQPDLTELPFGAVATRHVLQRILVSLGAIPDPEAPPDPPKPSRKKAQPPRARSRSSAS